MHKKIIFTCSWNNINSTYPVMYEDFLRISKEREDVIVLNVTKVDLSFVKTLFTKKIKLLTIDHSIVSLFRFDYNKISNVSIKQKYSKTEYRKIYDFLIESTIPKIYIGNAWDLHWTGVEDLNYLAENIDALAWYYEKKPVMKDSVTTFFKDDWMELHDCPVNNWNLIKAKVHNRFELTHVVSKKEFNVDYIPLNKRKYGIYVPGANYSARNFVNGIEKFKDQKPSKIYDLGLTIFFNKIESIMGKHSTTFFRDLKIWSRKKLMINNIANSAVVFTCGSGYEYQVRKFFEIPIYKSIPYYYLPESLEHFGFKKNINYIPFNFKTASEDIEQMIKRPKDYLHIAEEAHNFIKERFLVGYQTDKFLKFMDLIADQQPCLAYYENGRFTFDRK